MSNPYLRGQLSRDPFIPDTEDWTVRDQYVNILKREELFHKLTDNHVSIVTGANRGLGKQIAKQLVQRGSTVVMACRNLQKCKDAKREILDDLHSLSELLSKRKQSVDQIISQKQEFITRLNSDLDETRRFQEMRPDEYAKIFQKPPPLDSPFDSSNPTKDLQTHPNFRSQLSQESIPLICKELHLDSFDSIRNFSDEMHKLFKSVHILVNNGGTSPWEAGYHFLATTDINEWHFQINFLGPFLLTNLLLDLMLDNKSLLKYNYDPSLIDPDRYMFGSRVINIGDGIFRNSSANFGDLQSIFSYTSSEAYLKSKFDLEIWGMYFDKCLGFTNLSMVNVLPIHFSSNRVKLHALDPFEEGASSFKELKNIRTSPKNIRPSAKRYQEKHARSDSVFSLLTAVNFCKSWLITKIAGPSAESVSTNLVVPVILSNQLDGYGGRNYSTVGPFISPVTLTHQAYSFENAEYILETATKLTKISPIELHGLSIPNIPRPKQVASSISS